MSFKLTLWQLRTIQLNNCQLNNAHIWVLKICKKEHNALKHHNSEEKLNPLLLSAADFVNK